MRKYDYFKSNLAVLSKAHLENLENEFIIGGVIDKFFIQFELSWKVLKELLKYEGNGKANSGFPREILKEAYKVYDFINEEIWLSMLRDRNNIAHIYDGDDARFMVSKIVDSYIPEFCLLKDELEKRYQEIL